MPVAKKRVASPKKRVVKKRVASPKKRVVKKKVASPKKKVVKKKVVKKKVASPKRKPGRPLGSKNKKTRTSRGYIDIKPYMREAKLAYHKEFNTNYNKGYDPESPARGGRYGDIFENSSSFGELKDKLLKLKKELGSQIFNAHMKDYFKNDLNPIEKKYDDAFYADNQPGYF